MEITCPRDGVQLVGVEYYYGSTERYDGVSEWDCPSCGYRVGRWTKLELLDGFIESRFGKRGHIPVEGSEPS